MGNAYNIAIKENVEIVQFPYLVEDRGRVNIGGEKHKPGLILKTEELKYFMFYDKHKDHAKLESFFVWDKIYKRDLFLRTMEEFSDELVIDERLLIHDDNLLLFVTLQNAKSYYYYNEYGYYRYKGETLSISNSINNANKNLHDVFKNLNFIFNYVPNEKKFKNMCYAYYRFLMFFHRRQLKYATEGIEFMKETIKLYLNCRFYSQKDKKMLFKDLKILNQVRSSLTKNE